VQNYNLEWKSIDVSIASSSIDSIGTSKTVSELIGRNEALVKIKSGTVLYIHNIGDMDIQPVYWYCPTAPGYNYSGDVTIDFSNGWVRVRTLSKEELAAYVSLDKIYYR
jgi:hypothetical protein